MVDWCRQLAVDEVAAVRALLGSVAALDAVDPVSEQGYHDLDAATPPAVSPWHGLYRCRNALAGYVGLTPAHDDHPALAELAVDPAFRGHGVGAELVDAALVRGGDGAGVWAHGDLPAARDIANRLGLRRTRELLQLRRSVSAPLPAARGVPGVTLRTYSGPDDDPELLRVNNAAFAWHPEQGGWSEKELAVRRTQEWFEPGGLIMAESDGRLLGFHWTKVHTEENPPLGEVYVVAVDPAAQGRGLGRELTLVGLRHLRGRGLDTVLLYTEADNAAAMATYTGLEFTRYRADIVYSR